MCTCRCLRLGLCAECSVCGSHKVALDPSEPESQVLMSYLTWVLGTKLEHSTKAESALSH